MLTHLSFSFEIRILVDGFIKNFGKETRKQFLFCVEHIDSEVMLVIRVCHLPLYVSFGN